MIGRLRDRRLGVAEKTRRYDLPLNRDDGGDFLLLLVALMTFLAVLTLAASLILNDMASRWRSGLENRMTVEIPAQTIKGDLRDPAEIKALTDKAAGIVRDFDPDARVKILTRADMEELVSPWLGHNMLGDSLPLPGMLSIEFTGGNPPENIKPLVDKLHDLSPDTVLDTHEAWLADLLNLTGALEAAAMVVSMIIAATTIVAVAGGTRSRIAIYAKDVELLHLMGASDSYITRQFQRHALILALQGAAMGTICAFLLLGGVYYYSGNAEAGFLPSLSLGKEQIGIISLIPVAAGLIAALTARLTVLRTLARMP